MQDNSGLKKILMISRVYSLFQRLVSGKSTVDWIVNHVWKIKAGQRVIDIGCGPGDAPSLIPGNVDYFGFDISKEYINTAKSKKIYNAIFEEGSVDTVEEKIPERFAECDVILCNGVLHHLDDKEAIKILQFAKRHLNGNGRFVCLEPTFLLKQTRITHWMLSKDRGQNVRSEQEWKALFANCYDTFETHIITGLIRIPYNHIYIESFLNQCH